MKRAGIFIEHNLMIRHFIQSGVLDDLSNKYENRYLALKQVLVMLKTWYFPDVFKAIKEMIRVTKQGGRVIFDLQNKDHSLHIRLMKERVWANDHYIFSMLIKYLKNVIKTHGV